MSLPPQSMAADNCESLFEGAPVAIWEKDFFEVHEYLRSLGMDKSELRAYLLARPEAVMECLRRVRVVSTNYKARSYYGTNTEEQLIAMLPHLADKSTEETFRDELLAFAGGRTSFDAEIEVRTLDGKHRLVRMSLSILPTPERPWSRVAVVFTDLSERHEVETSLRASEWQLLDYADTLQRTNEALKRVNSDLEQFAYAAAHDLREPLRTIALCSQLLKRMQSGKPPSPAGTAVEFILDSAERMEAMVSGLLAFAQSIEPPEGPRTLRTDARLALQEAINNLDLAVREARAEFEICDLPVVAVLHTQLSQVFQNLIGNAIKYRSPDRPLRIIISCEPDGDVLRFCVEDNGQGIRQEYQEKIFGIFKRLHGRQIQGNGIGLALCRRIVEHDGGRIWVESDGESGSRFIFTVRPGNSGAQLRS
ncbi:MAG: hypothetical protein H7Y20_18260 [Bryobacteraceae bacterium]|nr:hypothetical protein [Bryobacteraceae bacterium]